MNSIKDVVLKNLTSHNNNSGNLVPIEFLKDLNTEIKRSFIISSDKENIIRGKHAHKDLNQFLICLRGTCKIICDDGITKKNFTLNRPDQVLYIPNHIWSEQNYINKSTILLVFCDDYFKESDYIRNYSDFKLFREKRLN
tara:strand:- start:1613 stop:2032 length:420 start_codon:yes stop_codon:yes gene_type:complete